MINLSTAQKEAEKIIGLLKPFALRIAVCGSVRRCAPFVHDIEIVLIPVTVKLYELQSILSLWYKIKGGAKYQQYKLPSGVLLDLFYATPENWGLQFAIRTGSAEFSHRTLACGWVKKGYHSRNGVLWKDGKPTYIREEKELFNLLELPFIKPEDRGQIWEKTKR